MNSVATIEYADRKGREIRATITHSVDAVEERVWKILEKEDFEAMVRSAYEKKVRLLKESLKEKKEILPLMPLIKKDSPLYSKYEAKTLPIFKSKSYIKRASRLALGHKRRGARNFVSIPDIYAEKLKDFFVERIKKILSEEGRVPHDKEVLSFALKVIQKLKIPENKIEDLISASFVEEKLDFRALLQNFRDYLREN